MPHTFGTNTPFRRGLTESLAILPPEAFRAIAGHVRGQNLIAIGHWSQEVDIDNRCGCLMMNGYMKDYPDSDPDGAYTSPHIAETLGDYYGCGDRLTPRMVHGVARNFDGWAGNQWKDQYHRKYINPNSPADIECYRELSAIIEDAAALRRGS